jgi:hypothetical protein
VIEKGNSRIDRRYAGAVHIKGETDVGLAGGSGQ